MRAATSISKYGMMAYTLSALIPLSRVNSWWLRVWDFPRLQLLCLGMGFGTKYFFGNKDKTIVKYSCLSSFLVGVGIDLYRILPYTKLWPIESIAAASQSEMRSISLITVNVYQDNDKYENLFNLVKEKSPDLIFLLEVNERWIEALSELDKEYKYSVKKPLDNTYGLALYSRYPLEDEKVRYLVEKEVPSVEAKIKLPSGDKIKIFGLHPKPPRYDTGETTERDAELIKVAKEVRESDLPVIVMGDLNDVAWSHTTRLFRRISTLLDPRVGRESYPTFPTYAGFIRFPLDYIFHSDCFTLNSLQRLEKIGSDHFPIFASFNFEPSKADEQDGPSMDAGDLKEAKRVIKKA